MILNKIVWGAVRRAADDGHEFTLASEVADGPEMVRGVTASNAQVIPGWDKANPVVRIRRFRLTELAD